MSYKIWVEVSRKSLLSNLKVFQDLVGAKKVCCVVKANAYGHGLRGVIQILETKHKGWYGVDNIDEALEVRKISKKSILVLGYISDNRIKEAVENDISITLYSKKLLRKLVKLKMPVKVHLKIETGLNRQGLGYSKLKVLAREITKNPLLALEGYGSHFANVEDTLDPSYANKQLSLFKDITKKLEKEGFKAKYKHISASAAALLHKKAAFDLVRIGIALYGLWPSKETEIAVKMSKKMIDLEPALEWKSVVVQVKKIKTGSSVGYGISWFASSESIIAIIPVGYFDGYDRLLSNNSLVIIRNKYAPVVGRVAMNMIAVDVTQIKNVSPNDEVILLGESSKCVVSAEEIAQRTQTINYETVSRINPNIPRVVV